MTERDKKILYYKSRELECREQGNFTLAMDYEKRRLALGDAKETK